MELVIALRDHGLLRVGRGVRVWTGVPGEEVAKDFFFFFEGAPGGMGGWRGLTFAPTGALMKTFSVCSSSSHPAIFLTIMGTSSQPHF